VLASCCKLDVINGGDGFLILFLLSTEIILYFVFLLITFKNDVILSSESKWYNLLLITASCLAKYNTPVICLISSVPKSKCAVVL
jgi:hypothetical protein